ncbi:hypothetical protein HK18_10955 [Commensalibacter intestini]|uniref:AAA+ ATPase domain-containing protein n=1 Tax=Commensalibacter intestini TaxID=479936 RepID=A0A251ZTS2_9PROT|nr:AAA family ATPase [Commensalibacter intestini]OUI78055.1 hypothetical protein HK18_10955 [Commensalibacter intestini]
MKINHIKIHHFQGIKDVELELEPQLTIIVGKNGAGKTSILNAISRGLMAINNTTYTSKNGYSHIITDIDDNSKYNNQDNNLIEIFFTPIQINQNEFLYSIQIDQKNTHYFTKNPCLLNDQPNHRSSIIPLYHESELKHLFLYYKQDRGFQNNNDTYGKNIHAESLFGNLNAIRNLSSWWNNLDAQEARIVRDTQDLSYRHPELEAIRSLIKQIDTFKNIKYNATGSRPGLYLEKTNSNLVHVDNLSSGERSYIILLADLARRLQIIDPEKKLSDIVGVILIDEIELNLHPAWQNQIIPTLTRVFKNCQFIITTHSPQVLSTVNSDHIRILTKDENDTIEVITPQNTKGRTSNYILEAILGVSERSPTADDLINKFNNAIDESNVQQATKLLEDISKEIEGDAPELRIFKNRLARISKE